MTGFLLFKRHVKETFLHMFTSYKEGIVTKVCNVKKFIRIF